MSSRLLLVDALGIAYRAYFAIRDLATAAGRPTNAVFGFIKTLRQMDRIWRPTHQLVVFDGGIPPERLELLAEYKAQRPAMPETLRAQLPAIDAYLDGASIAHVRLEAKEADDVLASVAALAAAQDYEVLVATSDKDLLQIVNEKTAVIAPGKIEEKIGPAEVVRKTGVRPDQIVDWLALTGDSSDNIPGVPGVGAKTAADWLSQWGSLAEIWKRLPELKPPRLSLALAGQREAVSRNARLLRLQRDIHCVKSLEDLKCRPPDTRRLLAFFEAQEFHSLANDLRAPTLL